MPYKKNSDLLRFFKKFSAVLGLILIVDFPTGKTLEFLFFKEDVSRLTYVLNKTTVDMLAFGSSRVHHQYVPTVFEKKLNATFYNCGHDASKMIYSLAAASGVLERYKPKLIIIEIDPDDFSISEENSLSILLPYKGNPAVSRFIKYNGKFENIKMLSQIYPYNSMIGDIITGSISPHKLDSQDDQGYQAYRTSMAYHKIDAYPHNDIINERVEVLNDFLRMSNKKNVKITLVISPIYFSFTPNDPIASTLESFCKKYNNVSFVNYENDPAFVDNKLFKDEIHLNDAGAHKFSEDFANKLIVMNKQTKGL